MNEITGSVRQSVIRILTESASISYHSSAVYFAESTAEISFDRNP